MKGSTDVVVIGGGVIGCAVAYYAQKRGLSVTLVDNACMSTSDCYIAQKKHGEIIIGSTTEHVGYDAGVTREAMQELSAGAVRALPFLARTTVKRVWSGLRPGSPDELPILGPVDGVPGYLNATGHFRTGIVNSPLTGLMLAELMTGDALSFPMEHFLLSRFAKQSARQVG